MEGGLAPNATVMSWRGTEGASKAARSGHQAVMSPGGYCYLDSYQDAPATQPVAISGYLPLQRVYSYDPAPDSLGIDVTRWITGIQGNLWTEYVPTAQHAEYMLWPRMIAIAEIGWTPQALRSWELFRPRALKVADHMQSDGYTVFDLRGEVGNRRQSTRPTRTSGKRQESDTQRTLVEQLQRSRRSHSDRRTPWRLELWRRTLAGIPPSWRPTVDVTIDLEKPTDITYVGADFMQITGPRTYGSPPSKYRPPFPMTAKTSPPPTTIEHKQKDSTDYHHSRNFMEWHCTCTLRAFTAATSTEGCQFTDEIIVS